MPALWSDCVEVGVEEQAWTEDGILLDHDLGGRHQAGAIDLDPIADLDPGIRAVGQEGATPRSIGDMDITPEPHSPFAPDPQPQRTAKPWTEAMPAIA